MTRNSEPQVRVNLVKAGDKNDAKSKKHIKVSKTIMTTITSRTQITYHTPDSVCVNLVEVGDKNKGICSIFRLVLLFVSV